jgi:nucleotide-binding universal stress UspA family protein
MPEVRPGPLRLRTELMDPVFGRIVVGTDGSDSALRAVAHACHLAAVTGGEVMVVHAYPKSDTPVEARRGATDTRLEGASLLRDAASRHEGEAPIRTLLRQGDPTDTLVAAAAAHQAELVVVGNRGLGRRRTLIGAVPIRVAHRAPCHLLIAHTTDGLDDEYRRVVLATDGSPTAGRAVDLGARLARAAKAEALVVHVGSPDEGREVLRRTVDGLAPIVPAEGVTVPGAAADGILEVAQDRGADLIVLGNRGMLGLRRFAASVPSRVARRAPCHVLLAKTT